MKCYCYETETEFVFCVEDAEIAYEDNIQAAWFKKINNKFLKIYPKDIQDKELLKVNFSHLGESMFRADGQWESALLAFAEKCHANGIEWYIIGSISEAVFGVNIKPHDIDIVIHVSDFYRVKDIFLDSLIEPFVDNQGTWLVRCFGRLCLNGVMIDIAADKKMNKENHTYDSISWNGYNIEVEPLKTRYAIELQRGRKDRIKAIEDYLHCKEQFS
jgi:hypothetical protein